MTNAIVFDIDGTLLDTREFILQAFEHVFARYNLSQLNRESVNAVMGMPLEKCYAILAPTHDPDELTQIHRDFQVNNIALVQPFPNTVTTLDTLRNEEIKIAAVTTRKLTGPDSLTHAKIADKIDCLITGDDVAQFKPHPEGIYKALSALEVSASEAIMVGDTEADIQAGKNAQTKTAAALYGLGTPESLHASMPDYLLNDIADLLAVI